jgi:hypothetical protein
MNGADLNMANFVNIEKGQNFVECPSKIIYIYVCVYILGNELISGIFIPPDNSFFEFRQPGVDTIANSSNPLSHRICVYGNANYI